MAGTDSRGLLPISEEILVQENLQIPWQTKLQDEPGTALAVMMA
jgi:hypothetical protein